MRAHLENNKTFRRLKSYLGGHSRGLWGGVAAAGLLLLLIGRPDAEESRTIFQKEPGIDFKGAEILGNPGRSILQGQESLFSKTQRSVIESETELKSQVAHLTAEVAKLQSQAIPLPSPSPSVVAEGYGPNPAPSSSPTVAQNITTMDKAAPGVKPSVVKDSIRQSRAAPEHRQIGQEMGMGFSSRANRNVKLGAGLISFPVKSTGKAFLKKPEIVLPSGSYVKAKLLTGVEAPEGKTYPILLELDYAYVLPNDKRLDLAGCFIIAKAQGDLSTERVQMQATKLSCVSKRGGMFEREINGFVADDVDNSFAVVGRVNSKQDRVAATAFLAGIVSGIGKAIQQAQTTSQTTPLGGSQTVLTGDQTKFIAAGGASEAATMVTQWYLKQAQNLLPTINVGSGQSVWVIMQDQVELPKDYFTQNGSGGSKDASIYSHFTRILD